MLKALHEAKVHTSWVNPDPAYDDAVQQFVARVLDEKGNAGFLQDFRPFQRRVSHYGLFNALAQTLLKITSPGVADTYQGTELWDFSLVDPDNRRPVDYERRRRMLQDLQARAAAGQDRKGLAGELTRDRNDGRVKLYVTWQGLLCRRDHPGLFATGDYLPATAAGVRAEQVLGFVRRQGDKIAVVAVPRLLTRLVPRTEDLPLGREVWQDTRLLLPDIDPGLRFRNVFTGEEIGLTEHQGQRGVPLADLFSHFPVALLVRASA
jgi:(1->4)-alpha-D-glucan 1-alpha-D-glucosylmutase